jgi:hypothetical protein
MLGLNDRVAIREPAADKSDNKSSDKKSDKKDAKAKPDGKPADAKSAAKPDAAGKPDDKATDSELSPDDAVHVNMRVGSIMSLLGTATGRVFAAFLPPKMIENFIESGVGRASVGDEAERQMSRNQIDKAVAEVREKGLARAVERPIPGVNAFSAPVFDSLLFSPSLKP